MADIPFGDLANVGLKIGGMLLDRQAVKSANAERRALADQEAARQREFAQMGVQWKVKDALAAGVHPLFALGASTSSYAPQSIGVEKSNIGSALADMGQDVSRAVAASSGQSAKASIAARDALQLESLKLDNDIKRATLKKAINDLTPSPGIPIPEENPSKRKQLYSGGSQWETDPNTSSSEDWEDRYGDDFPGSVVGPAVTGWNDLKHNLRGKSFMDVVRILDQSPSGGNLIGPMVQAIRDYMKRTARYLNH